MSNKDSKNDQNYFFPHHVKSLANNERFSDVSFLVGENEKLIYAHKLVLASGSPVMESMFFGNLAEKNYPIKVPDLTENGFLNMLRYMYGNQISFDLSIIYEVYKAADKYLVYNLTDKIFKYLENNLNLYSSCLIYDQLIKINKDTDVLLDRVRELVKTKTKETFSSEFFKQISKECLIDILEMNPLNIDEIDIIRYCLEWIEAELLRTNQLSTIENKRSIFKEIRPFITFSKITIQQLVDFKEINSLLNEEEIGKLFLHLADNKKPIPFECKTQRKFFKSFSIYAKVNHFYQNRNFKFSILLNTNQEIIITNIETSLMKSTNNLVLNIFNDKDEIIHIKQEKMLSNDDYWNFKLDNFIAAPNTDYKILFEFDEEVFDTYFSDTFKFETNNNGNKIILNLNFDICHCINKISFLTPDCFF